MRRYTEVLISAIWAVATFEAPQLPAQGEIELLQPEFHISVDRVQIGAVVTDSKGRHVSDLGIGDFIVLDDGNVGPKPALKPLAPVDPGGERL